LCRERASRRLRVKAQCPRARILRAVALDHRLVPDAPSRAILGNLLEEIAMRIKEERKLRDEYIHIQPAAYAPLDVFQTIPQSERQFLNRRRTRFANVIPADGNGI